jgi:D-sedoheptulose 7-phosphate isomerase
MNKERELINGVIDSYKYSQQLKEIIENNTEVIILGNGGSSSISSHISQDYTKKLKKRSFTFSDPSRLTCYSNDYGYDVAYLQFLKEFLNTTSKTLVILISSSGNSENILNCAKWCSDKANVELITLTGFDKENKLKMLDLPNRKINFWVDSSDYGVVECVHQIFLHMAC